MHTVEFFTSKNVFLGSDMRKKERSSKIFPASFDFSGPVGWHGQVGIPYLLHPLEVLQAARGTTELLLDCKKSVQGENCLQSFSFCM